MTTATESQSDERNRRWDAGETIAEIDADLGRPVSPAADWADEPSGKWTTPGCAAGGAAWSVLTHSTRFAADLTVALRMPKPDEMGEEDVHQFIWDLVTEAAQIGYTYAKIEQASSEAARWSESQGRYVSDNAMARAVAAILGHELVEDTAEAVA